MPFKNVFREIGGSVMGKRCAESDIFTIPLPDGRKVKAVIARRSRKGMLFCYFFDPRVGVDDLTPENAIFRGRVGDILIRDGEWPIIGKVPDWDRSKWPVPWFVRRGLPGLSRPLAVKISEDDLVTRLAERPATEQDIKNLPSEALSGMKSIVVKLEMILSER